MAILYLEHVQWKMDWLTVGGLLREKWLVSGRSVPKPAIDKAYSVETPPQTSDELIMTLLGVAVGRNHNPKEQDGH